MVVWYELSIVRESILLIYFCTQAVNRIDSPIKSMIMEITNFLAVLAQAQSVMIYILVKGN